MAKPPNDEPTVKDLLSGKSLEEVVDEATKRELEKWFSLPSFDQLAETPQDVELEEARKRREAVAAAVDPALHATIRARAEEKSESWWFKQRIDILLDERMPLFDPSMADRAATIAEPREVERPEDIEEDLKECAPQALLRDLHRPELEFDKTFEVVDIAAEQRVDGVHEVKTAMTTSWKLPPFGGSPHVELDALFAELRAERRQPWPSLWQSLPLANRKVKE